MQQQQDANTEVTLESLAQAALARDPKRPAIQFEGQWHSWGELSQVAQSAIAALEATGAGERQPVVLIPPSHPWSIAVFLGLIAMGRTIDIMYAFQKPPAIASSIKKLDPAVVFADAAMLAEPEVQEVLRADGIAAIAYDDTGATPVAGFAQASRTDNKGAPEKKHISIHTSGTTGTPKQKPFPYEMFLKHHVVPQLKDERETLEEAPGLLYFPLGNISGLYTTLPLTLRGQRGIMLERFSFDAWLDWVREYRPAMGGTPAAMVQTILDRDIPKEDLSSFKYFSTGAAPVDPTVQKQFEERYGIPILLSYGATEFGGPVTWTFPEDIEKFGFSKRGSVGRALPNAKIRVVDPETFDELPAGSEGLLEVVSPRIGPEWIRTADVGYFDEDGFLFITGRADNAIMRGGFKLVPDVIERAIMLHDAVAAVAVDKRKDRRLSEVPVALVQCESSAQWPGADELEAHVRKHLPATHVPVDWIQVDALPLNRSGKVDRPAVRDIIAEESGQPAA